MTPSEIRQLAIAITLEQKRWSKFLDLTDPSNGASTSQEAAQSFAQYLHAQKEQYDLVLAELDKLEPTE